MKFETAMQTAARLGVTVRAVQKWAKEGKLPGAKKVGRDWAIPFGATVSAGTDLPGGAEESLDLSGLPFPLFQLPYNGGDALEYIQSIADEDTRNINLIQMYYFMGEIEKSIELAEPYLDSSDWRYRVAAALFYTFANLGGRHMHKTTFAAQILKRELAINDLTDEGELADNSIRIFAAVVLKTQLHIPFEEVPLVERYIRYMPEGLRMMSCYLSAHKAYMAKDYARSLGIAQAALFSTTQYYPVCEMYCHIICAIDHINLLQREQAADSIRRAWAIAARHKIYMPFVEHYSLLQGLIESHIKDQNPAEYEKVIRLARAYNIGWYEIYNQENQGKVSFELTPVEFTIAMLYSRNWRAKEIAAHMHIFDRTVTNYIQIIYEKLNINSRKELEEFVLK